MNCFNSILESGTSRIYQHIIEDDNWAIISGYVDDNSESENIKSQNELKSAVRQLGYGFSESVSRWVSDGIGYDERSILIPGISKEEALKLGAKFKQKSIIVKYDNKCEEICTTAFKDGKITYKPGATIRMYNISGKNALNISDAEEIFSKRKGGPASKPIKGNAKPFTLKTVEEVLQPRPSYFTEERKFKIFGE